MERPKKESKLNVPPFLNLSPAFYIIAAMRRLKIFLLIILLLAVLSGAGIYYLNRVFIPGPFKGILISKAKEFLGRDVTIKEIGFTVSRGIFIKGVRVEEKIPGPTPFIKIDEASLGLLLPDLFKTGTIIIPSVTIHKPFISIHRSAEREWNFADLLEKRKPVPTPSAKPSSSKKKNILLNNIALEHARVQITDEINSTSIEKNIELNLAAQLSTGGDVLFDAEVLIPQQNAALKSEGRFAAKTKKVEADVEIKNFDAGYFIKLIDRPMKATFEQAYIQNANLKITSLGPDFNIEGALSAPIDLTINKATPVRIKAEVQTNKISVGRSAGILNIKGQAQTPALLIVIGNNRWIEGQAAIQNLKMGVRIGQGFEANADVLTLNSGSFKLGQDKKFYGNVTGNNIFVRLDKEDLTISGGFIAQNAKMDLAGQTLTGNLTWNNAFLQRREGNLTISGGASLPNAIYDHSQIKVTSILQTPAFTFNKTKEGIQIKSDLFNAENLDAVTPDGKRISSTLQLQDFDYGLSSKISRVNTRIFTKVLLFENTEGIKFSGRPEIEINLTYDPSLGKRLDYSGTALFKHDALGLSRALSFRAMDGKVKFNPTELSTDDLQLTLGKTAINLKGQATELSAPLLDFTATATTLDIEELSPLISQVLIPRKMQINGQAENVRLKYYGQASSPATATITASADLKNGEFTWEKLPHKVIGITGNLQYSENWVGWKELSFSYNERSYSASGSLSSFQSPEFETSLSSDEFNLNAIGKFKDKLLTVSNLKGHYLKSIFDVNGRADFTNDKPDVVVGGNVTIALADLNAWPGIKGKLKALSPQGQVTLNGQANLTALAWQEMGLNLKVNSEKFLLKDHPFQNLNGTISTLPDKKQNIQLAASLYDGALSLTSRMNLTKTGIPADVSLELIGLNLQRLRENLPNLKNKQLSGELSLNSKFNGPLAEPNRWQGSGAVKVEDGKLIELEVLKGVWKVLFGSLILDDYKNLVFTQGTATFDIAGGKITSNDLTLRSTAVDITAKGNLDFQGNLSFDIIANMKQMPIATATSTKGVPTAVISQLARNAFAIRLTGSISHPKTSYKLLPFKAVGKTTESIFQGIQGMLEDVLE